MTDARETTDWTELSARAAMASHQLVGWTFWDPVAIERYTALGVPDGLGYYINSRGAPLLPAGHQAVTAAFATIHPGFIQICVETALAHTTVAAIIEAHDEAVAEGLRRHVPEIVDELGELAEPLWAVADQLPSAGRVLFAAHRQLPRPEDQLLSAWLAVNCIREWRGDTHFAILASEDIGPIEAGVLDDARRDYGGWIARSRGADDQALADAFATLQHRGLAFDGKVNRAGIALRDEIEVRTDRLTERCWQALGELEVRRFIDLVAPVGDRLVRLVDDTAGPRWMPAARTFERAPTSTGWMLDETASAGRENLDAGHVARYDAKEDAAAAAEVRLLQELGLDDRAQVVDLGAGTGQFTLAAASAFARVIAVDVSPVMLQRLSTKVEAAHLDNVEVVAAGFLSYDHEGVAADVVYTRYALHHLPDLWKVIALRRMHQMLRPGGLLRLSDIVYGFEPAETTDRIEAWCATGGSDVESGWSRAELEEHVRDEHSTFTWLLEPMLERCGFTIEQAERSSDGILARYVARAT